MAVLFDAKQMGMSNLDSGVSIVPQRHVPSLLGLGGLRGIRVVSHIFPAVLHAMIQSPLLIELEARESDGEAKSD